MKKYVLEVNFNNGVTKYLPYISFEKNFLWWKTERKYAVKQTYSQGHYLYWMREFYSYDNDLDVTLFNTREYAEEILDEAIKQNYKQLGIKSQKPYEIN